MKNNTPIQIKSLSTTSENIADEAKVLSFNVGHGDCTLIEYLTGGAVVFRCLVDAGTKLPKALLTYLKENQREDKGYDIDVLVLSHVDSDHQGGLSELLDENVKIGEYLGPCLPTFLRLNWLFAERVRNAVDKAKVFEDRLTNLKVPVTYPLEGFSSRYANGRVILSVLSPAGRLLEKLSTGQGGDLSSLLINQPLRLEWLNEPDSDNQENENQYIGTIFRNRLSLFPSDFNVKLPDINDINKVDIQNAARKNNDYEPDFFGNSVLNDTSLIIAMDIYLDGGRRKRVLLTGDQENWSYLVARHSGGLGVDLLKAPHHGGRVYLDDKSSVLDSLYLWLRPRTVFVSANGHHNLPRSDFRDSLRSVGATLLCPNVRGVEPLTAGASANPGEKSCFKLFNCAPAKIIEFNTMKLTSLGEQSDVCACVQGSIHGGTAPIVVLRQDVITPSESVTRYTRGELEKHAKWIQDKLNKHHVEFKRHAADSLDVLIAQEAISWKSIASEARAEGRHDLAADPMPVLSFAKIHRHFWVDLGRYNSNGYLLYKGVSKAMLNSACQWLLGIPRLLLYVDLRATQVSTMNKIDILQSADWDVVQSLLAGKLGVPKEMMQDEVLPFLFSSLVDNFTAKVCDYRYPSSTSSRCYQEGGGYLWLERRGVIQKFPDLEHDDWADLISLRMSNVSWTRLKEVAEENILLGDFIKLRKNNNSKPWTQVFDNSYQNYDTFDQKFKNANWTELW